jgi:nicotinamide mononucleotide (NMN) deamidase PncC
MELAKTITDRGTEAGLTVCSAESCAGGLVTAALTDIAGIAVCTTGTVAPESP